MTKLKKLPFALILSILTLSTFAATEFEDTIPIELAKALLGNSISGETKIYTDIPDEFPQFQIPAGFEVLGSIDRGYSQSVVFTTELTENEAILQIFTAFEDVDFVQFDLFSPGGRETGFVSSVPRRVVRQMCHDDTGNLSVSFTEVNNIKLVSLSASTYRNNNQGTCAQQIEQYQMNMQRMSNMNSGIREYIPRMEAPDDALSPALGVFLGSGFSGSNNEVETEANLRIEWSIDEVYSHFEDQINAQDWEIDSQNVGVTSAIGTWTLNPEPDLSLVGVLTVLKIADSNYKLSFKILATGERTSNSLFIGRPRIIRN